MGGSLQSGRNIGVPQNLRDGNNICPVGDCDRCESVAELVRVEMVDVVLLAKLPEV